MNNPFSKLLQFGRIKMNLKYIFFTSGLTFLIITAVKCWYRCAELTFCDKLRSRKASSFSLMVSGKLTSTLTGKLVNKDTRKYYDFFLTAFDGGKFSIYVDDPRNPRYRVKDSLAETPREILLTENATRLDVGDLVVLKFGEIKINLFTDPFNLTAYRGDKEFVRVNSRELLTFEEYPYTEVALDFVFPQALRAYGLPEHADQLSLRTTTTYRSDPYRLYNIDRYGYEVNSQEALYGSVPVLYAIGTNVSAGVFWMNSAQTFVDITNRRQGVESYFMSEAGSLHAFVLSGPTLQDCVKQYANLTALDGGKFSIYVNDPMNPRHRVKDSLAETPRETFLSENATILDVGELVVLKFEEIKIDLFTDPFNLTAYRKSKEFVRVNSRELLTFEEYPDTEIALDFVFPQALRAYGLPEHAEKLSLSTTTTYRSEPYRLYNIDRSGYEVNSQQALYGSVPVLYAIGTNVSAGVFWMNSAQTYVDITNKRRGIESYFMSEAGSLQAFVLSGPNLRDCVKQYANLTGVAPLPQMFALGYHQSRYSYMNQVEVLNVCEKFDKNKFPLDAIWLDIDYTNGKKYFTWDPKAFPAPDIMLDSLEKQGRKAVAIIDPHIKRDTGYSVFDECETKGYFVKNSNGTVFQGSCWPGASSWIDFFNPEARNYYSTLISEFAKKKNLHIWNDMNEPSIFLVPEQAMNGSCVHYNIRTHQELHNQYGFYQTMATYEGLKEKPSKVRPFILTRSFFAGSQRFAAHWTGDNVAKWEHLKISIPMILTEALAGISFVGADIGGFAADPTDELLQRWYQAGAWYPFYRSHSFAETKRREPYLFKDEVKTRIRNSLQQRYRHLTHWYTLFWQHYQTGEPIIRPLSYHYNDNVNTFDIDDEFLVGADILIHPITDKGATNVTVYLPGGEHELWYNIDNFNNTYLGIGPVDFTVTLDTVPVFYKGGSIIPINHVVKKSTAYMKGDPITLLVFLDKKLYANGYVYDDDHESFNYLNKNYTYVNFTFKDNTLQSEIIDKDAWYNQPTFISSVVIYGYNGDISKIYIGKNTTTSSNEGVSVSIDFQKMYTCGTQKNNTVTLDNLNIDIRDPFVIKFNENIPK